MTNLNKTTIVLADNHQVVRQGLRALLEAEPDFKVVGEAADDLQAIRCVQILSPRILILDLMMPGLNGLDVVLQIKKGSPNTQVVILSMYANEAYVLTALSNGASTYLLKSSSSADLIQAVREAAAGRKYLSPHLSDQVSEFYQEQHGASTLDRYETLTAREKEVLRLAAEGHTNAEVAASLGISTRTAETHRSNLMHKLHLETLADLIRYGLRHGIISME